MSSTKTLKNFIPKVVEHHANKGNFLTREVLYSMVRDHQDHNPWDYGKSKWSSTFGSLRSWISDVMRNKSERTLKNVHSFEKEGVQYFYTDIQQVFNQVQTSSNIESTRFSFSSNLFIVFGTNVLFLSEIFAPKEIVVGLQLVL